MHPPRHRLLQSRAACPGATIHRFNGEPETALSDLRRGQRPTRTWRQSNSVLRSPQIHPPSERGFNGSKVGNKAPALAPVARLGPADHAVARRNGHFDIPVFARSEGFGLCQVIAATGKKPELRSNPTYQIERINQAFVEIQRPFSRIGRLPSGRKDRCRKLTRFRTKSRRRRASKSGPQQWSPI